MEVSGQLHAPAALPSGKEPPVPIGYEAGWAPQPVWKAVEKTLLPLPGIELRPSSPSRSCRAENIARRPRRRWEDNININNEMDLKMEGCGLDSSPSRQVTRDELL
jgi:hypothetical protein